ncbi:MAG: ABC transporter substrate-binding protein [Rhodospirillales bacterium]|nr:ABC transporter substrate-binding protein [Rhodospirillales bacterium]
MSLSRRHLLALSAASLASWRALAQDAPLPDIGSIPAALKGSGEVRVVGYGGTMQTAQRKAYNDPFEQLTGIKVRDFAGADLNKVKAMVDTGNVEWDVVQLSRGSVKNLMKRGDYFEKIDYELVDVANIDPAYRFEYALDMLVWAEVLGYRTDAFKGAVPVGWKDFWDLKKFPGDRSLIGAGGSSNPELEFAVMAAGVSADKVYPIDVDKAFAALDKVKPSIVKWWDTGAVPVQMLTDKEVVMTSVWNGRMAALQAAGVPAAISWPEGLLKRDAWAVPKNAPNKANAMKYIAFTTMAAPMARLASLIPYGSVNAKSNALIAPAQLAKLPSAPGIKEKLVPYDYEWWAANRDAVLDRWNKWILA